MSDITSGIDRIHNWLQSNHSEVAASFKPGSSIEEIYEKTQWFPFQLSSEIYELLQCVSFNKSFGLFGGGYNLLSLNAASRIYQSPDKVDYGEDLGQYFIDTGIPAFPLFASESLEHGFAVCDSSEDLPVISIALDEPEVIINYSSLTNMILTLAEAYESNVFTLKVYNEQTKYIECINEKLFRKIIKKYDSNNQYRTLYKKQLSV